MDADSPADLMWVDDDEGLARLMLRLADEPRIAIDTESNSMHAYFERVCLVQVSVPGLDALIDALAVDIAPLGEVLADPQRQKVFHGADYDVLSLKRAHGFAFDNLFDTMLAAKVLGWDKYGLAAILAANFGVKVDKRFQRHDWGERPVSPAALEYARRDTHYLLRLRDIQWSELTERDRLEECVHACQRQARVEPRHREFDPDDFWRIKGVKDLGRRGQAIVRSLYVFRDQLAKKRDRPPFRIINDGVIVYLAQRQPKNRDELAKIKGVPRPILHRHATELLAAIAEGQTADVENLQKPAKPRLPREVTTRYERLRTWRKEVAAKRGVEPDIVIGKESLMAVASANPATLEALAEVPEVDDWERDRFGAAILEVLGANGSDATQTGDRPRGR